MRRRVVRRAGPNRGRRRARAGRYDRSGPPCLDAEAPLPPSPSRPEPRRLSGHLRHTVQPGPPWRSAPICQIHGSAPRTRTRTRTHNNHCHPPEHCLAVGSRDGRYGTKQPAPRTGWKQNISSTHDETAHMLLITGRSTICSYVACKRLFLFCLPPSLFWAGADAISILTMSLTKIGHFSCLHHRVNIVSCLFNHIAAETIPAISDMLVHKMLTY